MGILTGSAAAQLMALAAIPLLARLYNPEETAHYALLMGIGAVVASFASLRLDLAIPLPQQTADGLRLFWVAALVPTVVLPVTGLGAMLLSTVGFLKPSALDTVDFALIAAFVMVLCVFTAASQLAIRMRSYGLLGRIPVLQMAGTLIAQVSLGAVGFSRGLFVGGMVGRSLGIAGLLKACGVRVSNAPDWRTGRGLLRRYWRFPVLFAPASAVEVLGSNVVALMLPALFGLGPAGLFAMAYRVSAVPATVLGQSAGQVFLGEFARTKTRTQSLRVFLRWSGALTAMGVGVAVAIWILAPLVLPDLLGDSWAGTAQLAQFTGVVAGAAIIGSPVQHVWTVRQRAFMQFGWNLIRLGATTAVVWFGAKSGGSLAEVAAALAIATSLVYLLAWLGCLFAAATPSKGSQTSGWRAPK